MKRYAKTTKVRQHWSYPMVSAMTTCQDCFASPWPWPMKKPLEPMPSAYCQPVSPRVWSWTLPFAGLSVAASDCHSSTVKPVNSLHPTWFATSHCDSTVSWPMPTNVTLPQQRHVMKIPALCCLCCCLPGKGQWLNELNLRLRGFC